MRQLRPLRIGKIGNGQKSMNKLTVMAVTVKIGIINDTDEGDGDDHHEDDN